MGLLFVMFVDLVSYFNMFVLVCIMDMLVLLLFLIFNGYLWLILLLVDIFYILLIGGELLNSNVFLVFIKVGSLIFFNGLMLVLLFIILLLILNLVLGLFNCMVL